MTKKVKDKVVIKKEMNLAEVVFKYPEVAEILMDYGLHCIGCIGSSFDSIEAGANIHQLTEDEVKEMMERINEVVNFGE